MHAFTDPAGRPWELAIHVAAAKRVRGVTGVDLYGLVEDGAKPLGNLLGDPVQLVDVLYVLCQRQAEERKLSDEDFGRLFDGDMLATAIDAFVAELTDFFPSRQGRQALQKLVAKGKALSERVIDLGTKEIEAIDIESAAQKLLASSGSAPASSASIPAPSLSASS